MKTTVHLIFRSLWYLKKYSKISHHCSAYIGTTAISHLENSITVMETLLSHRAAEKVTEI